MRCVAGVTLDILSADNIVAIIMQQPALTETREAGIVTCLGTKL